MPRSPQALRPGSFNSFGELLHYLRRRARLTQTELGIAVGYSDAQISRLEKNQRLPDPTALMAVFIPALALDQEPDWVNRLLELAALAREMRDEASGAPPRAETLAAEPVWAALESIPSAAPYEVERLQLLARLQSRLKSERRVAVCALGGMGKTTLAAQVARAHSQPALVFWITLTEGVNTTAEAIAQQLLAFIATQALVGSALVRSTDSTLPIPQQITLIGSALTALAKDSLPLLCFDNFHLIQTEAALQLVRHLLAATPVQIIFISREEVPFPEVFQLTLTGLEESEGELLVERLADGQATFSPLDPLLTGHLLDKTGGSPMLLRLAIGQLLDRQTDLPTFVDQLEAQPQVAAYLLDTVQRQLSPAAWHLLTQVSVFRRQLNLRDEVLVELIQAESGGYELGNTIAELQRRQLIDQPAQANLHPLIRDFVYNTLATDPVRRRRLHLVAAEWADYGLRDALRAAYHYSKAGQWEQVVELLTGEKAELLEADQVGTATQLLTEVVNQARRDKTISPELLAKAQALQAELANSA